jgi:hypothetical protein
MGMDIEKVVQYECKVCGRRIDVTRSGDVYEEPIFCCGVETSEVMVPGAAPAAPKPRPAAKKKPAKKAKKKAAKKAKKKAVKKKAAKKAKKKAAKKKSATKKAKKKAKKAKRR